MRSEKRNRQYKILSLIIFGSIVIILVTFIGLTSLSDARNFELNEQVNKRNHEYAKANSFGFTDKERVVAKSGGVYRIAVLGDSFIWGDGLPYENTWGHKLERKLLEKYDSVEIMSWGKCGWSTLDEINFFKEHGKDYNIDLLIIGWVDNDPDMGNIPQVHAGNAEKRYPILYKISPALARFVLNTISSDDYGDWMERLYSPQNLSDYQKLLTDLHQYLKQQNVKSLIVMTPNAALDQRTKQDFDLIKPLFAKANFSYLEIYDTPIKKFEKYDPLLLQANDVNGHPGNILTEEFASETEVYLEQNGYLKQLHKKERVN